MSDERRHCGCLPPETCGACDIRKLIAAIDAGGVGHGFGHVPDEIATLRAALTAEREAHADTREKLAGYVADEAAADEVVDVRPCSKCGDVFRGGDGGYVEENGGVWHMACHWHVVREQLAAEREAHAVTRGERDQLQKVSAMLIHWAETAHDRLRKLVPWESEVPGLSDLADDVCGAFGSIANEYDFKQLRLYDRMQSAHAAAVAALEVALEALEFYAAGSNWDDSEFYYTGCVEGPNAARAAMSRIAAVTKKD